MSATRAAVLLALLGLAAPAARASRADPRVEAAVRESVLRLTAGDVTGAEAQAQAAVAAAPADPRALQQLARAANAALDFPTAEAAATKALGLPSPAPILYSLRSEARAGHGDYAGALADAESAAALNPGSGTAVLRLAVAEEGLGRAPEALADYRRAAVLDPALGELRDAAVARLAPRPAPRRGLGALALLLGAFGAAGWAWGRRRSARTAAPAAAPRPALAGAGILTPERAVALLESAAASAPDPESSRALAESLYERLTGVPPYPPEEETVARSLGRFTPPSRAARGLPVGVDAFFARALDPDPARRFPSGAELAGAFRSLVRPAVD
jgi:tetratricopeptide (TPR) repeat protein